MAYKHKVVIALKRELGSLTVREYREKHNFRLCDFNATYHIDDKMIDFLHMNPITGVYYIHKDTPLGEAVRDLWHLDYANDLLVPCEGLNIGGLHSFKDLSQSWG